jgi:anti-sigma B factor antagonist
MQLQTMDDCVVLTLYDECLDAGNAGLFKTRAAEIIEENKHLVIDIGPIRFVDSAGLGALLSCLRLAHAKGGRLALCGVDGSKQTLFQIVRMDRLFDIHLTPEAAVRALREMP